jgi:hypothetical protein
MKEQARPSGFERLERFWQLRVSRDYLSSHLATTTSFGLIIITFEPVVQPFRLSDFGD